MLRLAVRARPVGGRGIAAARRISSFLSDYQKHVDERAAMGIVAKPLNAAQVADLTAQLSNPPAGEETTMLELLTDRVPPGVDEAAYVKAGFLAAITKGEASSPVITPKAAVTLLGTMQGGYNISPLVDALDNPELAPTAADALAKTILMFDAFHDVEEKAKAGNEHAKKVMQAWADAEWFTSRPVVAEKITVTVFMVSGETNTDDLSPAPDAWSRPDIPLHALAMLKFPREGIHDSQAQIDELKEKGFPLAYVGDVVGTGSSRKSATNSVLWYMGDDIPFVPNKRGGGICIGGKIAPIFFNTMEDSGALPIEMDVTKFKMGDVIEIYPYEGVARAHGTGEELCKFSLKTDVLFDEVRAGGRIPLIIGRALTARARESLGLAPSTVFRSMGDELPPPANGYSLAQKMVG
jgi:aconitate hydratase 2/2-methylisocitrate dehydratase